MRTFRTGDWARIVDGPPGCPIGETVLVVPPASSGRDEDDVCTATVDGELLWLKEHQLEKLWR